MKKIKGIKTAIQVAKTKKEILYKSEEIYRKNEAGEFIPLPAQVIEENWEETTDINFDKIWLGNVLNALEDIGNKRIKIASYILSNRDKHNNYLIATQRDIADACGVSTRTVNRTLSALIDTNLIVAKAGIYQVNPECIIQGGHNKRMAILRIYQQNKNAAKEKGEK